MVKVRCGELRGITSEQRTESMAQVGFAGSARYSEFEWTQYICVNLGGTASAFVPWMKANYFLEE
jgi:hypothetical protein